MRAKFFMCLMFIPVLGAAQSLPTGILPPGAHIEGAPGGLQWAVMPDGRRAPWNLPCLADLSYNSRHAPKFPAEAIRQHHFGAVVLMALIGKKGEVRDVKVEQSSTFPELDGAALDTVKGWKFSPTYISGQPTDGYARIPINFPMPPR